MIYYFHTLTLVYNKRWFIDLPKNHAYDVISGRKLTSEAMPH